MVNRLRLLAIAAGALLLVGLPVMAQSDEPYAPEIDPANFVLGVDNPYFPLTPEATYIYEGETANGLEHIEVTVLEETRAVMGIPCVVVRDTVTVDGEVIEDTYDWYAQDRDGNVWYMGEQTAEYENGIPVSTAGSWEAGVDGALAGIIMPANPIPGEPYRQEYFEGEAEDMAQIERVGEAVEVAYGAFSNVVVIREWNPLNPGVVEEKAYAPGVGVVLETVVEGGSEQIELIAVHMDDDTDAGVDGQGEAKRAAHHDSTLGTGTDAR